MEEKSPVVAAFLSLLFPGIGSLYAGKTYKGLAFMAIFIYTVHALSWCSGSVLFLITLWGFAALEAYNDVDGKVYSQNLGWGIFWLLMGTVLLLWTLNVFELRLFSKLWPLFLIGFGIYLIILSLKGEVKNEEN